MKNLYKNILSVCLLMCFALSASAQVTQIWNNDGSLHKVKIDNDKLFVITSTGVYEQNLDESGNLSGNGFELSKLFDNFGYEVIDFIQNGDQVIVITNNNINQGETIFKSVDRGSTWVDVSNKFKESKSKMRLLQSDYDKEAFYAQVGSTLYYSSDFGETFEYTTSIHSDIFDCSKFDSKVLVYSTEYLYIEEYHYIISHDSGQTQSTNVDNFMITHDIAFHYSDPNKILLIGNKIVLSEDGGKTWQHLTYSKNELDCIDRKFKFEFSKSGSDRLYITDNNLLYYSDDYGVTWNELYELDLEEGDKIEDFLQHGKMIYSYTSSGKIYQMNLEELEAIEEPSDYEYTPLVREGVVWEYFHDGWTSKGEYYSRIYISGEENINDTIYHKCYIVNPYSKNECIAYLREEDKKVYLLSLDQNVAFQYNTNGQEILIYDFNLNEGDSYSIEIEGNAYDFIVAKVDYEEVDGKLRKTFEIFDKETNSHYAITEGIGVVGVHGGFFCFPYAPMLTGKGNPLYIGQEFYEYTPLVREGAEWGYFIGDTAEEVDFYRLRLSGEEEINGNIYKKCWCYTDCEFSESTAVLCGYLREEDKRVYVLYQNAGSEHLLYDFNLQEGDQYGQHPWFNGDVTLPIESVDYVLTTEGLRKRYFVGSNVCYIEGIGIVGTHLGDMLRPNDYPYEENATFNYEKNQGNNVVYQQTDNEIGFTDPCINYGASYEYTPLVREGVVWHYSYYGELYKFSFLGEEEIDGKIYRKCYKFDEKSDITESNGTLIAYLREENRQVYSIFDDSEETMIYDFNLKVGDIYNNLYNQFAITAIDYVSINNCLTKRFKLERENEWIVEGVGVVSELGHYFFCPFYPTPSGIGMSLPPVLYKQTTIDGQVLVSYTWDSVEKVTQNELAISQAENVVTINGATGKVNVAIYTFDGMKVAEASGSESVSLSTAELPIGIYVVKATDSTGNKLIQKIVIK